MYIRNHVNASLFAELAFHRSTEKNICNLESNIVCELRTYRQSIFLSCIHYFLTSNQFGPCSAALVEAVAHVLSVSKYVGTMIKQTLYLYICASFR